MEDAAASISLPRAIFLHGLPSAKEGDAPDKVATIADRACDDGVVHAWLQEPGSSHGVVRMGPR